jgi:hypothetical protein
MTEPEIIRLIDAKIREHEVRVAIISGITGGAIVFGIFHAIWLLNLQSQPLQ